MNDKIYQSAKWIAIGILLGYFGKYALALLKAKSQPKDEPKETELNFFNE